MGLVTTGRRFQRKMGYGGVRKGRVWPEGGGLVRAGHRRLAAIRTNGKPTFHWPEYLGCVSLSHLPGETQKIDADDSNVDTLL
jgi:hypothetical protein